MTMFHNDNTLHLEALCPEQNYLKTTKPIAFETGLIMARNKDAALCRFCILHEDRRLSMVDAIVESVRPARQWVPVVKP